MNETQQKAIFDEWLNQHKGIFFKIVRAYAFTPHDQEDLFQEIAIQVWQSIPDFRGESKASTWIYRVALFRANIWVRKEKQTPPAQSITAVEHILTTKPRPNADKLDWLYTQIGKLEPLDRTICLLMLDGYKHREIADIVGLSTSNISVKMHRIKQQLTSKAQEYQHG